MNVLVRGGQFKDHFLIESTRHYTDGTEIPRFGVISAKSRIEVAAGGGVIGAADSLDAIFESGGEAAESDAEVRKEPTWFDFVDGAAASIVRDALRLEADHVVHCVPSSYRSDYFELPSCAQLPIGSRCERAPKYPPMAILLKARSSVPLPNSERSALLTFACWQVHCPFCRG